MNRSLDACLSVLAAPHGRPRTPQSWCETVEITRPDGRVIAECREFFVNDVAGRAALLILSVRLGPDKVREVKKMIEFADRVAK